MRKLLHTDGPPSCFGSATDWQGYLYEAMKSGEPHTICDDCSQRYRAQMQDERRCHEAVWMQLVINMPKRRAPVAKPPPAPARLRPGCGGRPRQLSIRAALLQALLALQDERAHLPGIAKGATVREIARRAQVGFSGAYKYMPLMHAEGMVQQIGKTAAAHTSRPVVVWMVAPTVGTAAAPVHEAAAA